VRALPSCGPAPKQTDGGVTLTLRFPNPSSGRGVARLTNGTDEPRTVADSAIPAVATVDGSVVSTGGINGLGPAAVTVPPGEFIERPVGLFTQDCSRDASGSFTYERALPAGEYDAVADVYVTTGGKSVLVISAPVAVTYRP
jgi:hypothetical protein